MTGGDSDEEDATESVSAVDDAEAGDDVAIVADDDESESTGIGKEEIFPTSRDIHSSKRTPRLRTYLDSDFGPADIQPLEQSEYLAYKLSDANENLHQINNSNDNDNEGSIDQFDVDSNNVHFRNNDPLLGEEIGDPIQENAYAFNPPQKQQQQQQVPPELGDNVTYGGSSTGGPKIKARNLHFPKAVFKNDADAYSSGPIPYLIRQPRNTVDTDAGDDSKK
jgi:hypothetical protein